MGTVQACERDSLELATRGAAWPVALLWGVVEGDDSLMGFGSLLAHPRASHSYKMLIYRG